MKEEFKPKALNHLIGFVFLIISLTPFVMLFKSYWGTEYETIHVNKTERVCGYEANTNKGGSIECKYMVFSDKGVFKNTDSIFIFKFNSSDIYGEIHENNSYEISYYGWRFRLLSMYPNIKTVKLAQKDKE